MGRDLRTQYKEYCGNIKTNNPRSAYTLHILNNRHEYGNLPMNMKLIQSCNKSKILNCWENFYIQVMHQ